MGWRTVVSGGSVQFQPRGVVEPDDRHVAGHGQACPAHRPDRAEGEHVAAADDAGDTVAQDAGRRGLAGLQREERLLHWRDVDAGPLGMLGESRDLAARRHMILGPDDQADPLVAERGQVPEGLPGRDRVVGGHAREVQVVDRGV